MVATACLQRYLVNVPMNSQHVVRPYAGCMLAIADAGVHLVQHLQLLDIT